MDNGLWITLLLVSVGTLLLRLLPLLWMQRHLLKQKSKDGLATIPDWLTVLGPLMIAAMLGVSLVPGTLSFSAWCATAMGSVAALLVWHWTKSLGWPVLVGVSVYGAVILLATVPVVLDVAKYEAIQDKIELLEEMRTAKMQLASGLGVLKTV